MNLKEWISPKRAFALLLVLILCVLFHRKLVTAIVPFIVGILLAALLDPLINFLENRLRMPRSLAVGVTLLAAAAAAFALLFFSINRMVTELIEFANRLPSYGSQLTELTDDLLDRFSRFNENIPTVISLNIERSIESFLETVQQTTRDLINRVLAAFTSLPTFLFVSLITLVSTYFVARDKELLVETMLRFVPDRWRDRVSVARERIAVDLVGYIKGRVLLLIIALAISGVGLFIIGTRYWVLLALVIAVLDTIPIIGPGIVFTPWVAACALTGDLNRAVYLSILYFVIFAVHQLAEPKIMGDSVGVHPLVMLAAIYGGIVFFGVWGIIVGPFIAILIKAVLDTGLVRLPEKP